VEIGKRFCKIRQQTSRKIREGEYEKEKEAPGDEDGGS